MKNLEKEYKEQISHEAPDLWSRIEAGVDAYEASRQPEVKAQVQESAATPAKDNITPIRKKNIIAIITRITAVAACVLILAATAKITRRTKSESAAPSPAADAAYSDSAESTAPSNGIDYEDALAGDTACEAEEPSYDATPIIEAEKDSDKNLSPTLSPSESAIIKEPVAFDDERDELLPQLEELGFKRIKDFVLEDDSVSIQALTDNLSIEDNTFKAASFTDSKSSDRYYVVYTINDEDKAEILIVKKADDAGDILYTAPSLDN